MGKKVITGIILFILILIGFIYKKQATKQMNLNVHDASPELSIWKKIEVPEANISFHVPDNITTIMVFEDLNGQKKLFENRVNADSIFIVISIRKLDVLFLENRDLENIDNQWYSETDKQRGGYNYLKDYDLRICFDKKTDENAKVRYSYEFKKKENAMLWFNLSTNDNAMETGGEAHEYHDLNLEGKYSFIHNGFLIKINIDANNLKKYAAETMPHFFVAASSEHFSNTYKYVPYYYINDYKKKARSDFLRRMKELENMESCEVLYSDSLFKELLTLESEYYNYKNNNDRAKNLGGEGGTEELVSEFASPDNNYHAKDLDDVYNYTEIDTNFFLKKLDEIEEKSKEKSSATQIAILKKIEGMRNSLLEKSSPEEPLTFEEIKFFIWEAIYELDEIKFFIWEAMYELEQMIFSDKIRVTWKKDGDDYSRTPEGSRYSTVIQDEFIKTLEKRKGSPEIQKWYDAAQKLVKGIE